MTSLTKRTSGLVQRKTEAHRNAEKERGSDEEEDEARRVDDEDDDKGDAKDTRLTLMEEVLLLGLKDREVSRFAPPAGYRGVPPLQGMWSPATKTHRPGGVL